MLTGEPGARATEPGVDFVGDQKRAQFVRESAERTQRAWRRHANARPPLDWFEEESADRAAAGNLFDLSEGARERFCVAREGDELGDSRQLTPERRAEMRSMRGRERAIAQSMLAAFQSNDPASTGRQVCRF